MIERVLCCPLNYSHRQEGQLAAFREVFGADNVAEFDFLKMGPSSNALLPQIAKDFKPDWIWLQVQGSGVIFPRTLDLIERTLPACVITHWMGDARVSVPSYLAGICKSTHATLVSSVGQLGMYRAAGARRVEYVQIGLDYDEDVLGLPPWEPPFRVPDVVFCGGYYGGAFAEGSSERLAAIRALVAAGIDVGVVGSGWPKDIPVVGTCHVKQQHHVYKRAKVALSINHFNGIERYYSDRQLIAMASGTPVVARYVPGLEKEFEPSEHCMFFTPNNAGVALGITNEPFVSLIHAVKRLLDDPELADYIGKKGREKVIAEHTWTARIRGLRPLIEGWQKEIA